jgi:hypothetical protein
MRGSQNEWRGAVALKRIGETVLMAAMIAAPAETLTVDPVALFTRVSNLRQVGLEADARRLAVDAALGAEL